MLFRKLPTQGRRARPSDRRPAPAVPIEAVESRTLLSATVATTTTTAATTMSPDIVYDRSATSSATTSGTTYTSADGYSPDEIRTAYGFASAFSDGTAANGAGQTIAIIDAYNDPNIRSDLAVFDAQFGIAAPTNFSIVNQTGGTNLPSTSADWAGEIALDVEWAHAIAPAANILLVEASSDSTDDLMAAVNYARSAAGVSVVSMSWGGSEYVSWGQGGESSTQTTFDADFATPAGHKGVTFVAAAGDSGQQSGVQWPASSANVLSVGGTTLYLSSDGSYLSESGWAGTSSGRSEVESEPSYQDAVNTTGYREVADVAYDADPNTGFAVYDSLEDSGYSGWQDVGGTSAGAPQWAALVAIADQARSAAGLSSLDGVSQTLPTLYGEYSAYGTDGYAAYTNHFNDVTTGGSGGVGFRHGPPGSNSNSATYGYDLVTGLGSPQAASLIAALAGGSGSSTGTGSGSGSTGGTTSGGGTTTSTESLSPVAVAVANTPAAGVIAGQTGTLKLKLTNTGSTTFSGPVTITLYASTDGTVANAEYTLKTVTIKSVRLRANASETVAVKYTYTAGMATGSYDLIASAAATGTDTQATTAVSSAVAVAAQSVDLSVAFANTTAVAVTPGKRGSAVVTLDNLGNVTASGTVTITLYASTSGLVDGSAAQVYTVTRKVKIAAGKSLRLVLPFTAPADLTPGGYSLVATIAPSTSPGDTDSTNNTAVTATQAT